MQSKIYVKKSDIEEKKKFNRPADDYESHEEEKKKENDEDEENDDEEEEDEDEEEEEDEDEEEYEYDDEEEDDEEEDDEEEDEDEDDDYEEEKKGRKCLKDGNEKLAHDKKTRDEISKDLEQVKSLLLESNEDSARIINSFHS